MNGHSSYTSRFLELVADVAESIDRDEVDRMAAILCRLPQS